MQKVIRENQFSCNLLESSKNNKQISIWDQILSYFIMASRDQRTRQGRPGGGNALNLAKVSILIQKAKTIWEEEANM